jgi:autotransporter strand-loop-strand O-heptosyltransferase
MKLLYVTPHLSTGGMPQFVLKRIEYLQNYKEEIELFLVEYSQFSDEYVVQRNQIIELLGEDHFWTLGSTTDSNSKKALINIIKDNNIDLVHFEEIPEGYEGFNKMPIELLNQIYSNDRSWKIVESCHNVWLDPSVHKKLSPDAFCLVTPYHLNFTFSNEKPYKEVILYPFENKVKSICEEHKIYDDKNEVPLIEKITNREKLGMDLFKTHVLNVGLWTEGKNQKEMLDIARIVLNKNPNIHFHFVGNQAPNFESYWKPITKTIPSNVTIWGERNDVDTFMKACDFLMFNSTWECNPLVVREAMSYGMKIFTRNLPQYVGMFDEYIYPIVDTGYATAQNTADKLLELIDLPTKYKLNEVNNFGEDLYKFYQTVMSLEKTHNKFIENDYTIVQHYVNNPFLEILGKSDNKFKIEFLDGQDNLVYTNEISINSWIKLNREYFTKWKTKIYENDKLIYNNELDLENKRVYISMGSKSLGDTMAWFPYCEEFRKKHNCKLIVSTFMNHLFCDQYPEIEFSEPGEVVMNIHAQYKLGWFYDEHGNFDSNKHPNDFKKIPLQKTASDILGLDYKEIRPKLKLKKPQKRKRVGIGFHSTAQSKYWNNPTGWQEVVDYLKNLGYEVILYSREENGYMGNHHPSGANKFRTGKLEDLIPNLETCEFFIGLGSGLSWLAWACELPVVLISGFSEKWAETTLDTYRVINENVCHGCFNKERLDAGDWNWCPLHKGTDRQFECTKQITSEMVIKEINKIMNEEQIIERKNKLEGFDWGGKNNWYSDAAIQEIENDNMYDRFFTVEEGDIVVDLGASLGPFTYSILPNNPKQCYVVEPLSYQIDVLHKNVGKDNVKIIQGAITDKKKIEITWDYVSESVPTFTFKEFLDENGIDKIDFLKCDCEGGEYDVFQPSNIEFLKTIPKIVTEFHMRKDENFHNCKFRWFRDNILPKFDNYQVFSVDGVDIKWDLWNEHFLDWYCEVIIYIDNR